MQAEPQRLSSPAWSRSTSWACARTSLSSPADAVTVSVAIRPRRTPCRALQTLCMAMPCSAGICCTSRVQAHGIVETDNVLGDVAPRLVVIGVLALPHAFHLQVQKEALHHRVVPTISLAAHAANHVMPLE